MPFSPLSFPSLFPTPLCHASALAQGLGDDGGVLGSGFEAQFGVTAGADKALGAKLQKARGKHLPVGQLFAHVAVVNAAGKDKGNGLTGKIFNYEVFHGASLAVLLGFASVLQVLAHGLVVVRKIGGKRMLTAVSDGYKVQKVVLFRGNGRLERRHAE